MHWASLFLPWTDSVVNRHKGFIHHCFCCAHIAPQCYHWSTETRLCHVLLDLMSTFPRVRSVFYVQQQLQSKSKLFSCLFQSMFLDISSIMKKWSDGANIMAVGAVFQRPSWVTNRVKTVSMIQPSTLIHCSSHMGQKPASQPWWGSDCFGFEAPYKAYF